MSSVIKSYLVILLIILSVFVFTGIISANADMQNARDYHAAVVNEIENSNHANNVIEACKTEALTNDYELVVTTYLNNSDASSNAMITKVVLKYTYTIDFLSIASSQEIVGYAR